MDLASRREEWDRIAHLKSWLEGVRSAWGGPAPRSPEQLNPYAERRAAKADERLPPKQSIDVLAAAFGIEV